MTRPTQPPPNLRIVADNPRPESPLREQADGPRVIRPGPPKTCSCPQCGAIRRAGRWSWGALFAKERAGEELCPACRRINEHAPAGEIVLAGRFVCRHQDEIVEMVRNVERAENTLHPLRRVMELVQSGDRMRITTTDTELPLRLGRALRDVWAEDFDARYDEEGCVVRIDWRRDD